MSDRLKVPEELLQHIEEGQPQIKISRTMGFTVNIGGYESTRIDSMVEITGKLENKDAMADFVQAELEHQTKTQVEEVVKQYNPSQTLLGLKK